MLGHDVVLLHCCDFVQAPQLFRLQLLCHSVRRRLQAPDVWRQVRTRGPRNGEEGNEEQWNSWGRCGCSAPGDSNSCSKDPQINEPSHLPSHRRPEPLESLGLSPLAGLCLGDEIHQLRSRAWHGSLGLQDAARPAQPQPALPLV